jgi:D-alanyl-D-alanine carboxypeptidase
LKKSYFIIFLLAISITSCEENSSNESQVNQLEESVTSAEMKPHRVATVDSALTEVKAGNTEKLNVEESKKTADKMEEIPKEKAVTSNDLVQKSAEFDGDYLMGKFDPNTHLDFSAIASKYASKSGMRMRTDAYQQFIKMYESAKKDGISIRVISATRPFHHQKSIWEAKWNGKRQVDGKMLPSNMEPKQKAMKILRWSSMPGTSRHHWGTDIDLNDLNNAYFEKGQGKKIYEWLTANASTYGFCQVYSPKGNSRPHGYEEEKWHWSYLPVARQLTNLYKEKLSNGDIGGFSGSESAELIDIKTKYVLGINPNCE